MAQSIDAIGNQANYSGASAEAAKSRAAASATRQVETRRGEPQKKVDATPAGDDIKVSMSAQVKLLKSQGLTVSMIASQLGLDSETITQYISGY